MKNMLDHNALICNAENLQEKIWPHFINQTRMTQDKTFLRNMYKNNDHQSRSSQKPTLSSPIYTTDKKKSNIEITDTNQHSLATTETSTQQNIGKYLTISRRFTFFIYHLRKIKRQTKEKKFVSTNYQDFDSFFLLNNSFD